MFINKSIQVTGCITQEKYIKGKSLTEVERILGFHAGRLSDGMVVAALQQIPAKDQFQLLGYTQVAEHRFNSAALKGLEVDKLKEFVRQNTFSLHGLNRLIKVLPNMRHQPFMKNDDQYPPGDGVPQWKLTSPVYAVVVALVTAGEKYA